VNAPPIELFLRAANVAVTLAAFVMLVMATRIAPQRRIHPAALLSYLTGVMGITAAWRAFLFWLGFQSDLGQHGWAVPWIQPMNAVIAFLLYFALAILAYYHAFVRKVGYE
jgi:hypothetical protein